MNPQTMAKLRQHQLTILDAFHNICQEHNLRYYLTYGTLIGAARHKGYIPWDDDIDVCMPVEDYYKFLKIGQKHLPDNMFLQTALTDPYHARYFSKIRLNNTAFVPKETLDSKKHTGIFIDIFPLYRRNPQLTAKEKLRVKLGNILDTVLIDKRETGKLSRWIFAPVYILPSHLSAILREKLWNTKGNYYLDWGRYQEIDCYDPADLLPFEDRIYRVPKNYDKVLRTIYGDYMQLPPEDQRITHNPFRISFDLSGPDENLND